ncbi:chemotaxis protein [Oryzifoliimicrobium ureilyticus]|uniref:chemotaxis protein n=1 Tax=Oryzifoliimicrobium ureilyticus TaxID=3113724 RepID=UPI003075FD7B
MPTTAANHSRVLHDSPSGIAGVLEDARSQVEKRFLEAGTVLLSVMDVLNRLVSSLDTIAGALDGGGSKDAGKELSETVGHLRALPGGELAREQALASLCETGASLRKYVAEMQETMRYLRTFAVTAKITGAGLPDFAGFAQEILERIASGAKEVNDFASNMSALDKDVRLALESSAQVAKSHAENVPSVAAALQEDAEKIIAYRRRMADIASRIGVIARSVQSKVAATLSALQIGDITRQRIEHVQNAADRLAHYLSETGREQLNEDQRRRLECAIDHLMAAQMQDMHADFNAKSRSVVETMISFRSDVDELLQLHEEMTAKGGDSFVRELGESVAAAQAIVVQVENAGLQADRVSRSTIATTDMLLQSIDSIRAIKTDISYMALNTNLRCSRLGEEGRSINVVTAELRIFAAKLEESANGIDQALPDLKSNANRIAPTAEGSSSTLGVNLNQAVSSIYDAANVMEGELERFAEHGQEVAVKINQMIASLDFQHDLGEILSRSADHLAEKAGDTMPDISDLPEAIAALDREIFRVYTMVQERDIHRSILPAVEGAAEAEAPVAASASTAGQDDDDDVLAALF